MRYTVRFQNGSLDYISHHNLVARCWYAGPTDVQSLVWFPYIRASCVTHPELKTQTDTVTDTVTAQPAQGEHDVDDRYV